MPADRGSIPIDRSASRCSDYTVEARRLGLKVETICEGHEGSLPGHHARYVLHDADKPRASMSVERVALTAAQVAEYGLASAPAKATDSRSKSWAGETCQFEALTPTQIADIHDAAIDRLVARAQMHFDRREEEAERTRLTHLLAAPTGAA